MGDKTLCKNCLYWFEAEPPPNARRAQCRRYPPNVYVIGSSPPEVEYPSVPGDSNACGEFKSD
jgi:hypothetical protein